MYRSCIAVLLVAAVARADHFEHYTNQVLEKAVSDGKNVKELTEVTSEQLPDHGDVLADTADAFLIVRTNDDRWAQEPSEPVEDKAAEGLTEKPGKKDDRELPFAPMVVAQLSTDVLSRGFQYTGLESANLRSYNADVVVMPGIHAEFYPLASTTDPRLQNVEFNGLAVSSTGDIYVSSDGNNGYNNTPLLMRIDAAGHATILWAGTPT